MPNDALDTRPSIRVRYEGRHVVRGMIAHLRDLVAGFGTDGVATSVRSVPFPGYSFRHCRKRTRSGACVRRKRTDNPRSGNYEFPEAERPDGFHASGMETGSDVSDDVFDALSTSTRVKGNR